MSNTEPTKPIDDELRNQIRKLYGVKKSHYINFEPRLEQLMQLITADRKQLLDRVEKEIISEDESIFMNGKRVYTGDTVDVDLDNNTRESLVFIQANGGNRVKAKQRTALAKLRKGLGL